LSSPPASYPAPLASSPDCKFIPWLLQIHT
jgi:hypothetical protein